MENIKENEKLEHPKELDYFIEISGEKINKYFDLKSEFFFNLFRNLFRCRMNLRDYHEIFKKGKIRFFLF